ncbi:MAG: hypothetical protein KBH07_06940 [Flavobacteriales bacterium]|nr:hypothetical protein [Flavobacteriales bacterium]MBP9079731.1 hypothetical protein [Flavobacteriales bacterium]
MNKVPHDPRLIEMRETAALQGPQGLAERAEALRKHPGAGKLETFGSGELSAPDN